MHAARARQQLAQGDLLIKLLSVQTVELQHQAGQHALLAERVNSLLDQGSESLEMQTEQLARVKEGMRACYFSEQRQMYMDCPASDFDRQWAGVQSGDWLTSFIRQRMQNLQSFSG